METIDLWIDISLFFAGLLSATLFLFQSDALLVGLIINGGHPVYLLILVASILNIAGSTINWWLGHCDKYFGYKPWFQKKEETLERAEHWYYCYGRWSLLLS